MAVLNPARFDRNYIQSSKLTRIATATFETPPENDPVSRLTDMVLALLSKFAAGSLNSGGKAMYFVRNAVMILAVAFLSFEFSLLLSRGLLLLVLHSMQRMESRVKGQ